MNQCNFRLNCLLAILFLLAATVGLQAQVYTVSFSGANEQPPNASPGTGNAVVTIDGTFMNVYATFSGLIGNTTASHIHAPTAVPGTGTVGVATTTPTFTGFPLGVMSGTYDHTFDMTLASSYNAAYITANGGTPATAFAALKAAFDAGKAYFNIHSSFAPGGEIRGFLVPCPGITVSIPDAFALPEGVAANTVYPAYAPASSITLNASVSGGTAPYSYSWSNNASSASITVSPVVTTTYSVSVKDANGCPGTAANKTVQVVDVAGGKNGDKINVCHKGNKTLTIDGADIANHLAHGDMLGDCAEAPAAIVRMQKKDMIENSDELFVQVIQNPAPNHFDIRIAGKAGKNVSVKVYDLMGRAVETKPAVPTNSTLRIGTSYTPGTYMVEVAQGSEKKLLKLMKWQ